MVLEQGQIVIGVTRIFYGSANGVVKILNDADVAEIAASVQTITWNRYSAVPVYHWGKYDISTTITYLNELEQISGYESVKNLPTTGYLDRYAYFFNSYTINTSNGTITLSGKIEGKYAGGTSVVVENCYTDSLENTDLARDTATSNQLVKINQYSVLNSRGTISGIYKVASTTSQNRGSYVGDVTSENYSAYPDNGISNTYWYLRGNTTYRQGTYVDQVQSRVDSAYPANGYQDGY